MDDKIDFAFTCKPISQLSQKLKLDPEVIASWKSIPIAMDPIVIVSNHKNGVQNLSTEQLTAIFQGKIHNWTEVGGNDLPVRTAYMNPELESGVNLLFKEFTVGTDGRLDPNAILGEGPSMAGNYVALTPGAVTFMAFNSYRDKYGDIVAVDGIHPSRENITSGQYGLTATYYLTLAGDAKKDVADFLDFTRSEDGTKTIEMNFIPYSE